MQTIIWSLDGPEAVQEPLEPLSMSTSTGCARTAPDSPTRLVLSAMAAHARGALELAEGDAHAALGPLRRAFEVWQRVEAPYAAARVRVLVGLACRALGGRRWGWAGIGRG